MKTWQPEQDSVEKKWWVVDATGHKIGRLATQIADVLRGKNKPTFTNNVDMGDFVIVTNCDKIEMSGNKWETKKYYRHSRWFGNWTVRTAAEMRTHNPEFIIEDAVRGMLAKSKMSERLLMKLKIYKDGEHPHKAQQPEPMKLN